MVVSIESPKESLQNVAAAWEIFIYRIYNTFSHCPNNSVKCLNHCCKNKLRLIAKSFPLLDQASLPVV